MSGTEVHVHPRHRLDVVIHSPVRFSIVATLAAADKAEFGFVRDAVEITDSVLSKQVAILDAAGYLTVHKGYVGKRPRTWLSLSAAGRAAFQAHLAALDAIAGRQHPGGRPGRANPRIVRYFEAGYGEPQE